MNPNNDLVEIYQAKGESEAQIIKSMLESYGIPSMFRANAAPSVHAFVFDGMGLVSILVRKEDEAAAKELVKGDKDA